MEKRTLLLYISEKSTNLCGRTRYQPRKIGNGCGFFYGKFRLKGTLLERRGFFAGTEEPYNGRQQAAEGRLNIYLEEFYYVL